MILYKTVESQNYVLTRLSVKNKQSKGILIFISQSGEHKQTTFNGWPC